AGRDVWSEATDRRAARSRWERRFTVQQPLLRNRGTGACAGEIRAVGRVVEGGHDPLARYFRRQSKPRVLRDSRASRQRRPGQGREEPGRSRRTEKGLREEQGRADWRHVRDSGPGTAGKAR